MGFTFTFDHRNWSGLPMAPRCRTRDVFAMLLTEAFVDEQTFASWATWTSDVCQI